MKKIIISSLMFFSVCANGQTDTSAIQFIEPSDSTGFGTPDGTLVSKQIGTAGGTIISDDGRVELIFPAGALTTNTAISIQPTTNLAPNGAGKSYWCEPSGTQFKKPVQIIFHYTEKESKICPPEWMELGIQDHKGKWTLIDYDEWDSTANTLKGFIHHFTGLSNILLDVVLRGFDIALWTGDSTVIEVVDLSRPIDSSSTQLDFAELKDNAPVLFYANSVLNGNAYTGKIKKFEYHGYKTYAGYKTKVIQARYVAPKYLPKINPVEILAEFYRKTKKGKILKGRSTWFIEIHDAYKVSVIHEFPTRGGMDGKLIDSASFIVDIHRSSLDISEIENNSPVVIKEGKNGPFKEKLFTNIAQGSIHLTQAIKIDSVRNKYPNVCFEFQPLDEIVWYLFQTRARGISGKVSPLISPSIRVEIEFLANGEEQHYDHVSHGNNKESYNLIIKPYRYK